MAVYSPDRVQRLRLVLYVVLAVAALLGALSALLLARGDSGAGVPGLVVAVVVGACGANAVRLLPGGERPAKVACLVAGAVTVVAGIALAGTWLALVLPLLGVGLIFLAVVSDPDA